MSDEIGSLSIVDIEKRFHVWKCPWCGDEWPRSMRLDTCPCCSHKVLRAAYNDVCPLCGGDWRLNSCHQAVLVSSLPEDGVLALRNRIAMMESLMSYPNEP